MLSEMQVAGITLNELSRRVGLAKSNVLRYFESREAVLLELLDAAFREWLAELDQATGECAGTPDMPGRERAARLAAILARSLTSRPVLCDLLSAQSAVLERNISPAVAARYKRATIANVADLGRVAQRCVPELGQDDAFRFAGAAVMTTGALWSSCQPSPAMLEAYEADPELAAMRLDFATTTRDVFEVLIAGLQALAAEPDASGLHR